MDQKLEQLRSDPQATVATVAKNLTPDELRALIGRFKTQAGKDEQLAEDHSAAQSNISKRIVVSAWALDPSKGSKYASMTSTVSASQSVRKVEKWMTQKEADNKWTEAEQEAHLHSGRLVCRETSSSGVWEYLDTQDVEIIKQLTRHM